MFDTVEVNNTFYRLPEASAFAAWRQHTPEGFLIAVKASRYLTHMKRLLDPGPPLKRLFSRACALESRLGPVLYQLPPNLTLDLDRLDRFLSCLATVPEEACTNKHLEGRTIRHAIEFRHPSWYTPGVFRRLADHQVALCLHDRIGSATPREVTADFVYIRFHGMTGQYHGSYEQSAIAGWAAWLGRRWKEGRSIYAYFNNDVGAAAIRDALSLRQQLTTSIGMAPAPQAASLDPPYEKVTR